MATMQWPIKKKLYDFNNLYFMSTDDKGLGMGEITSVGL